MTRVEKIYHRYEHLATNYARVIWDANNIGMDKEDLEQELRIKLFLAIKSYGKRWKEYKESGRIKPVPIEFFLKTVMNNKVKDFIRDIHKMPLSSLDNMNFDYGREDHQELELLGSNIMIGDVNLIDLFKKKQRKVMRLLILKDFDQEEVYRIYKGMDTDRIEYYMRDGLDRLRDYLETNLTPTQEYRISYTD